MAVPHDWIIYAAFGVLVCLLLWRIATQWRNAEAANLRISLTILGIVALAMVVWQGVRLLPVGATSTHTEDKTITVLAAASLTNALDDVDAAFTKQSGIKVVARYGASSALAKQIEQGAQMDVFASADLQWMDHCVRKKVDTRVNLRNGSAHGQQSSQKWSWPKMFAQPFVWSRAAKRRSASSMRQTRR